jgi:hypothetical protein
VTRYTPLWEQAGLYAASVDRRLIAAEWPAAAVLGCAVSTSSGMTVNIAAGSVAVPTANNTGTVLCVSDAVEQVTLSAAPASGSNRYDVIICQARANDIDGGANNDFLFSVVTGVAAASPSVPATPNNAVALANIYVPGASASVTAGNITDVRRMMQGDAAKLPQGRLAQTQLTASTANITTETTLLTLSGLVVQPNRLIRLEACGRSMNQGSAGAIGFVRIKEGATVLYEFQEGVFASGFAGNGFMLGRTITPTPGTHTYTLTLTGSSGSVNIGADPTFPLWLEAIDLGGI